MSVYPIMIGSGHWIKKRVNIWVKNKGGAGANFLLNKIKRQLIFYDNISIILILNLYPKIRYISNI